MVMMSGAGEKKRDRRVLTADDLKSGESSSTAASCRASSVCMRGSAVASASRAARISAVVLRSREWRPEKDVRLETSIYFGRITKGGHPASASMTSSGHAAVLAFGRDSFRRFEFG
jgi:hypothetical protein